MNETIRLKSVKFNWSKRNDFKIFVPELKIYDGEKILLLGESGSGKTTLLSLICGFLSPLSGDIFLNQNNIIGLSASKRDQYRSDHIGIIFQQFNLLPYANVIDNITLPLYFSKDRAIKAQNQKQAAINLCKSLRLPDNVKDKKVLDVKLTGVRDMFNKFDSDHSGDLGQSLLLLYLFIFLPIL